MKLRQHTASHGIMQACSIISTGAIAAPFCRDAPGRSSICIHLCGDCELHIYICRPNAALHSFKTCASRCPYTRFLQLRRLQFSISPSGGAGSTTTATATLPDLTHLHSRR